MTSPSVGEILVFALLFVCILCCARFCMNTCHAFREFTATKRVARDERYVSMTDLEDVGDGRRRSKREPSLDDLSFIPTVEHVHDSPVARRISKLSLACCTGCTGLLCILACLALVFYPHAPTYNVCNSEIDWNSVFSSLESLTIGVDYRVAISVDNGNRFAIEVNSLAAEFDFNGQSVATIDFREPVFVGSSINHRRRRAHKIFGRFALSGRRIVLCIY